MKRAMLGLSLGALLLSGIVFLPQNVAAADAKPSVPDKALCTKMMQFGKQSYQARRYLDAKEYFRKAVQADPSSATAWEHYDLTVIHALAEKIDKNTALIAPDASPQGTAQGTAPPPPAQQSGSAKKPKFVIEEDEGC